MLDRLRQNYLAGILSVLGGLLFWELVSRAAGRQPAVPGGAVADRLRDLSAHADRRNGPAHRHQLGRVRHRLRDRGVIGIAFGFGMASSVRFKQAMQPWISGFYATPTIALAPLFILWLGIGIWSKVLVVIFLVLFPVTINTEAGLRTTSERLIEMLQELRREPQPDLLQGVAAVGAAVHSRRSQARHRPRPDRRRGGGAVRLARRVLAG